MSDHWEYFRCQIGDDVAFVCYDHGIREELDSLELPVALKIRAEFRMPTNTGLPLNDEFQDLSDLEDRLTERVESGWRRWPPRLPEQPIFHPVTNEAYAARIARDWNVPESGEGFVTRFAVRREFMARYTVHQVGGAEHTEWWIPAEDLEELNDNIVGTIEVIARFSAEGGAR